MDKSYLLQSQTALEHANNEKSALQHFSELGHTRINQLLGSFQDNNRLYLVLKPVQGLPLHKLLQMVGPFDQKFAYFMLAQVAFIMEAVHAQGYIYRDIKVQEKRYRYIHPYLGIPPQIQASNFMVDAKGRVTLIDLGHAKRIGHLRTYTRCGTTHAMPPEMFIGDPSLNPIVGLDSTSDTSVSTLGSNPNTPSKNSPIGYRYQYDYYSFGILVYQILVGKAPFGYANSNPDIIKRTISLTQTS